MGLQRALTYMCTWEFIQNFDERWQRLCGMGVIWDCTFLLLLAVRRWWWCGRRRGLVEHAVEAHEPDLDRLKPALWQKVEHIIGAPRGLQSKPKHA